MKHSEFNLIISLLATIASYTSSSPLISTLFSGMAVGFCLMTLYFLIKGE